jgi:hypothetical protein
MLELPRHMQEYLFSAVDVSFWGNFIGKNEMGMSLNGMIIAEFGLGAITCTDLEGSAELKVKAGGMINDKVLVFQELQISKRH